MQSSRYARPGPGSGGTPSTRPYGGGAAVKGLYKDGVWLCDCTPRLPAAKFQVKKDSHNKGRWFYTCHQEDGDKKCGLFLWEEEAIRRENQTRKSVADMLGASAVSSSPPASSTPKAVPPAAPSSTMPATLIPRNKPINPNIIPRAPKTGETPSTQYTDDSGDDSDARYAPTSDDEILLLRAANEAEAEAAQAQLKAEAESSEGPRKAARTDIFSTPSGKRKFADFTSPGTLGPENRGYLVTPPASSIARKSHSLLPDASLSSEKNLGRDSTVTSALATKALLDKLAGQRNGRVVGDAAQKAHTTQSEGKRALIAEINGLDGDFLDFVSPMSTPATPVAVRKEAASLVTPPSTNKPLNTLSVEEIVDVLKKEGQEIAVDPGSPLWSKLEQLCFQAAKRTRGVLQSRDIARKALHAKESLIVELRHRITTLEAELDTEREIIKALRDQ